MTECGNEYSKGWRVCVVGIELVCASGKLGFQIHVGTGAL